jgi:nitrite reductase/ring-hydroxylating ferredoxin subunit
MFFNQSEPVFEKVCLLSELTDGRGRKFVIHDIDIAVFNIQGNVYAINNVCTHLHKSILCDGFVEDGFIACPAHGWQYNVADGKRPGGGRGVESYPVEIRGEDVYVKVSQKKFKF